MCIIIFVGIDRIPLYKTGLDLDTEVVGGVDNNTLFKKNYGTCKRFQGGPSCL